MLQIWLSSRETDIRLRNLRYQGNYKMAVRDVLRMGNPDLLMIAKPVTEFGAALNELIADMFDTMHACNGVGLAAPQIGVGLQLVIFGFQSNSRYPDAPPVPETILINPVITPLSDETELGWEGCLSVPGLRGEVPRYRDIRYEGLGVDGERIDRAASGFHARVVQHECDHLVGRLYPMLIPDFRRFGFVDAFAESSPKVAVEE